MDSIVVAQVQSLVRELRSHKLHGLAKKRIKRKKNKNKKKNKHSTFIGLYTETHTHSLLREHFLYGWLTNT